MKLERILEHFDMPAGNPAVSGNFSGLINKTYRVDYPSASFILQQINLHIFPQFENLMHNILLVTRHIYKKTGRGMSVVFAKDGKPYYLDGDNCYRVYTFIENSVSYDTVENAEQFYRVGVGFGEFQNNLADFDASALQDVIPDFHNTEKRLENLKDAVRQDCVGRAANAAAEIEYLLEQAPLAGVLRGLPLRVTHNDTKLNNILFDRDSGQPICVIDLDTVMSGSALYDFGDAVRYGANVAGETAENLEDVFLDLVLYEAFLDGFLSRTRAVLEPAELKLLPDSVAVMTYELALRFLEDHLRGDVYFDTPTEGLNLLRARVQIKLLRDVLDKLPQMRRINARYING